MPPFPAPANCGLGFASFSQSSASSNEDKQGMPVKDSGLWWKANHQRVDSDELKISLSESVQTYACVCAWPKEQSGVTPPRMLSDTQSLTSSRFHS